MPSKNNKPKAKAQDAKVQSGIDAHLASMPSIVLSGQTYTPAQLKAVYQADSAAIDASDAAHKTWQQKVLDERATNAATAKVNRALRSFVLGYFGEDAVAILGDFGFSAPKPKTAASVATKALAVAKATATKKARGVQGSVQKKGVTGGVTTVVLTQTPTGAKVVAGGAGSTPAEGSPGAAGSPPATAAAPAAGPVTPKA